jgi:hypothetical protein
MQSAAGHCQCGQWLACNSDVSVTPSSLGTAPSQASQRPHDAGCADEICVSFANMKFYLGSVQPFLGKIPALLV